MSERLLKPFVMQAETDNDDVESQREDDGRNKDLHSIVFERSDSRGIMKSANMTH